MSKPFSAVHPLSDRELMLRAIELARKCRSEPGKVSPKVAALVVKDGEVIGEAFRGELGLGDHAEYTLLEKKLHDVPLAGATLFTTLEPCTKRHLPKLPCAKHIVGRRLGKVVIGTLDLNDSIRGRGELELRNAGVCVARFDSDLMPLIEEMNRDFIRQHEKKQDAERQQEIRDNEREIVSASQDLEVRAPELDELKSRLPILHRLSFAAIGVVAIGTPLTFVWAQYPFLMFVVRSVLAMAAILGFGWLVSHREEYRRMVELKREYTEITERLVKAQRKRKDLS